MIDIQEKIKTGEDSDKQISNEELRRLFAESRSLFADEDVILNTSIRDLNLQLVYNFLERKDPKIVEDIKNGILKQETVFQNLDILTGENLTLAGNLLFSMNPQRYTRSFYIDCVYFDGEEVDTNRYKSKERIEGPFSEIYKHAMLFLKASLPHYQVGDNFNIPGKLEIPEEALSEIIINTLVHRDYYIQSSIKIFLFTNRLEIRSPGKLPNSLTVEKMKSGISIHRNPVLNSHVQYILPYSGLGSGIKRALKAYSEIEFINDTEKEEFTCVFKRGMRRG